MTEKEKAKELYEKMDYIHYVKLMNHPKSKGLPVSMYKDQVINACIFVVEEIIEETRDYCDDNFHQNRFNYWQEVKSQIELL
jgi:hypothetical protein